MTWIFLNKKNSDEYIEMFARGSGTDFWIFACAGIKLLSNCFKFHPLLRGESKNCDPSKSKIKMTELIGYIAAFLTTLSFLPQVIKTLKTRDTSGISLLMYSMFVLGVALWLIYGMLIGNRVIVIANSITFFLSGTVLFVKLRK